MYNKVLCFKSIESFEVSGSKVYVVSNPVNAFVEWLVGKLVYIEDCGVVRIRGVERFLKASPPEIGEPIGLLVTHETPCKNYEELQELAAKHWSSKQDAEFHIFLHREKLEDSPGALENIFSIIRQNRSLALTDPSEYIRCLADYLFKE